jgi:hypothetical protein
MRTTFFSAVWLIVSTLKHHTFEPGNLYTYHAAAG